jgi:hypothetical protein
MKPTSEVSIVIVSWNVRLLLEACIDSILATCSDLDYEIVVVDNASADGTGEMIRTRFPWVRLILNIDNVGFARANNQGFREARGEYVFILNPDTLLFPETLASLVGRLRENRSLGMVGPKIITEDGTLQQSCARRAHSMASVLAVHGMWFDQLPIVGKFVKRALSHPYDFSKAQEVEAISGAAMLVRGSVLREIGGFGEEFLHCGEDLALCWALRQLGWRIEYVATTSLLHYGGASSKQALGRTQVEAILSDYLLLTRTHGRFAANIYKLMLQVLKAPVCYVKLVPMWIDRAKRRAELQEQLQVISGLLRWRAPQ